MKVLELILSQINGLQKKKLTKFSISKKKKEGNGETIYVFPDVRLVYDESTPI